MRVLPPAPISSSIFDSELPRDTRFVGESGTSITSLILAAIYGWIRPALGAGWLAGVKFGILLSLFGWVTMAGWSGVFDLPNKIWVWWAIEQPFYYLPGGAVLGWLGEKLAPRR